MTAGHKPGKKTDLIPIKDSNLLIQEQFLI